LGGEKKAESGVFENRFSDCSRDSDCLGVALVFWNRPIEMISPKSVSGCQGYLGNASKNLLPRIGNPFTSKETREATQPAPALPT
jgi:hypothetical protein